MSGDAGLLVENLGIAFEPGRREAISGVGIKVLPGQAVGLVGESGSGKSLASRAVLGLLPPSATVDGRIVLDGISVLDLSEAELQRLRGSGVAMIFQDPMSSLNPVLNVGEAIAQVVLSHQDGITRRDALERAVVLMERVGIHDARERSSAYPHEFSGGMRQRIMIAMALAARPRMLMADEPTTALDVLVQAEILRLLDELRRDEGMGLILVSHDLAVVASICERIYVMYAGEIVEEGSTEDVLTQPRMPYTVGLLASSRRGRGRSRLSSIPGSPPAPGDRPPHCRFASRCPLAVERCLSGPIPMIELDGGHATRCIRWSEVHALDPEAFARTVDEVPHG